MRPLRYAINLTLDGCVDHRAGTPDEELHRYWAGKLAEADALLFGRVTYEMMESAWRLSPTGRFPDWMADWMQPFARTIDAARKYVVSNTLTHVDWNAQLLRGTRDDLAKSIQALKHQPGSAKGRHISLGGVTLPLALAQLDLIDEYEFVIHPRVAGTGPTLLAGLPKYLDLKLISQQNFASRAVAVRYEAKR